MQRDTSNIFRPEALKSKSLPEVHGELPVSYKQGHALALWILAVCVIAVCVWALCGRINENVYGGGVITRYSQYGSIVSPGDGILISLDLEEGDTVRMGQLVGRIFSNEDFEAFLTMNRLLQYHQNTFQLIQKRVEVIKKAHRHFADEEVRRLDASLERTGKQLQWYQEFVEKKATQLEAAGAMSQVHVMELREANNNRLRDHESLLADRLSKKISLAKTLYELESQLMEYELTVRQAMFEADQKMRSILYRSRVVSYCNGRVSNVNATSGDSVSKGKELVRITDMHAAETMSWSAYCYFTVSDAKKIRPGMLAAVTPSTVAAERDGSIYGVVAEVNQDLETRESLMSFYHNASFGDFVFNSCKMVPVKVKIMLSRNQETPSGFNWTSGRGPNLTIAAGTICSVRVTTSHRSPASLLFGQARRYTTGDGIMNKQKGFGPSLTDQGQ